MVSLDLPYTGQSPADKPCEEFRQEIAIIGMSGMFPLASSPDQFWKNLMNSADCVRELPANRRETMDQFLQTLGYTTEQGHSYAKGAYLEGIDIFDYSFFHLSPEEARLMDPAQRLFMQTVWHTLEEAGYGGGKLRGTQTGVFYGYSDSAEYKYSQIAMNVQPGERVQASLGNLTSLTPSRISYLMDWRGPNMVIDTLGSSSLVALHQACQSVRLGECEQAVVGTVWINLLPLENGMQHSAGYGEAVISILIKPLKQAQKDGDHIHAVIKGSAVNQNGSSIQTDRQSAGAVEALLVRAWENAGIDPASLSFIEGHAAESEAGALEIDSLHDALTRYGHSPKQCAFTSVASHLGNLKHATGLAGLIKSVMALKHRELPPLQDVQALSTLKETFNGSPVYLAGEIMTWNEQQTPLRCGVSSFGMGGTNCHVVLEEAPAVKRDALLSGEPMILTLSAQSESALLKLINQYAEAVIGLEDADLPHLCYTANTGRGHYRYRIAMAIYHKEDLRVKLSGLLSQPLAMMKAAEVYYGVQTEERPKAREQELHDLEVDALCQAYVDGEALKWDALYHHRHYRRLSLPLMPFEEHRCWVGLQTTRSPDEHERGLIPKVPEEARSANPDAAASSPQEIKASIRTRVKELFCHYLGFEDIDEGDSFYELGGDSIVAVKIVNDINKELRHNVTSVDLLKYASISQFSDFLEQIKDDAINSEQTITLQEARAFYPLSSSQRRLFVMTQFQPDLTMYNMPHSVIIEGKLDASRLQAALNRLIRRHESLRTSFRFVQHEPMQEVHEHAEIEFEFYPPITDESLIPSVQRQFTRTFDLAKAPLMHVALAELTADKHVCFLDMHHIISDGSSMAILMKELLQYYEADDELEPLSIQYKDYAIWQNELMEADRKEKLKQFWLDKFADPVPVLTLHTDYSRTDSRNFEGGQIQVSLSKEQMDLVYLYSKKTGVTSYVILLAVYHLLFTKYSSQEDIIIGTWVQGRPVKELNELIGMFVQTIPMRNRCSRNMTFSEFIEQVQSNTLQSFEHQDYPFEDIVNNLNIERDLSRNPMFDVAFSLQNMDKPLMASQSLRMEILPTHNGIALFDITLYMYEGEEGLTGKWEYSTTLFQAETIERMGKDYFELLVHLVDQPDVPLGEIELIFDKELEVEQVDFLF